MKSRGDLVAKFGFRDNTVWNKGNTAPYKRTIGWPWVCVHVFYRGDLDPDCHDHPWNFVTFPLVSYVEHVRDPDTGEQGWNLVEAWRFHYRPADYQHRVIGRFDCSKKPVVTLVLKSRKVREWGFWRQLDGVFVHWKTYING